MSATTATAAFPFPYLSLTGLGAELVHKMDHLVCFLPGLLAITHSFGIGLTTYRGKSTIDECTTDACLSDAQRLHEQELNRILDVAKGLMSTCFAMYEVHATGLAPEIVTFHDKRPEDFRGNS